MRNKDSIRSIFIYFLAFICIFPLSVKADGNDYEVRFRFFKMPTTETGEPAKDVETWYNENYLEGDYEELTELNDNTVVRPGDYIIVSPIVKTVGDANAMVINLYYQYDKDIFEGLQGPENKSLFTFPPRLGGIFPGPTATSMKTNWSGQFELDTNAGIVSTSVSDGGGSNLKPFNDDSEAPFAMQLFKVKDTAPAGKVANFVFQFMEGANTMIVKSDKSIISTDYADSSLLSVYGEPAVTTSLTGIEVTYVIQGTKHTSLLEPDFLSTTHEYNTTVPNAVTSVIIKLPVSDSNAFITSSSGTVRSVEGGYELDVENLAATIDDDTLNVVEFTLTEPVEGEDTQRVTIYTVNITRIDNGTGFNLTLDGISPSDISYNAETKTYTASTTLSSTTVTATPINDEAEVTSGNGFWNLSDGENTREIVVNGADCQSKHSTVPGSTCTTDIYTVKVTKLSTEARLQTLVVTSTNESGTATAGTLSPIFNVEDAEGTIYTYTYPEGTTKVKVEGTVVATGKANITSGSGEFNLADTTQTTVVVTAEDGITKRNYTVKFVRKMSNDGSLSSLTVKNGETNYDLTPGFTSDRLNYTLTVPHLVDSVTIEATATSPNIQSITGTGDVQLNSFDPISKDIVVKAEDGTNTTYTIVITREKSDNAFLTSISVDGEKLAGFDKTETSYTYKDVRGDVGSLTVTYEKEEPHAQVSITGTDLVDGMNTITLTVTAQNGSQKAYTIAVKRLSGNANLQDLTITSDPTGTLTPGFSGDKTSYVYKYDRNVSTISVSATAISGRAVVGAGSIDPSVTKSMTLTSTSEDGTTKVYTISFVQELESDSTLASLEVKDGETNYSPVLTPGTNTYTVTVPGTVGTVDLIATPNGSYVQNKDALGTIRKTLTLSPGKTTETFDVIAEDGTHTTYTVEITRTQNTEAYLTSLSVDGESVQDFSSTTYSYNLEVAYNKTQIIIDETHSLGATVTGNSGAHSLDIIGVNTIRLEVVSEDGKARNTYTINVKRKSRDASIINLVATSTPVSVVEKVDDTNYRVDVPNEATSVTLVPTVAAGATVLDGEQLINIDPNAVHIVTLTVQAEDGNTKTYNVTLNVLPSSNAYLESLSIDPGALKETFDRDRTSYTAVVATSIDKINVSATAEDEADIEGDGEVNLDYGDNTIVVKVTAEDKTVKNYTITVTRMKKDDKSLRDLKIDGTTIAEFEPNKTSYTINVPYNTSSVNIEAIPNDSDASVSGDGTISIAGNSTTVTFNVKAHDNTTREYTVIINKNLNDATRPIDLYLLNYLVTWNETEGYYEVTLDSEILKAGPNDLVATLPDGASFVSKGTELDLPNGQTDFDYNFIVKAQDNHQDTYTIKIHRELSTVNTLENLTSDVGTFDQLYNDNVSSYNLTLPIGTTVFTINAPKDSARSTVFGAGEYTIPVTNDKVVITVMSENNNINTYEINVSFEADPNVLETLSVEGFTLTPEFDGTTLEYSIGSVELATDTLTVNATTSNPGITIKYIDGNNGISTSNVLSLPSTLGENSIKVRLENSSGEVLKTYTITYNKKGLERIISSVHTLDDDYVLTARPGVAVDTFITEFDNDPADLFVYASDGETRVTDKNVGTGMVIKLERGGEVLDQLRIIIVGDTNGDGAITVNDAAFILNHALGIPLSGAYLIAGDVNKDNSVTVNDAAMIVNHTLGNSIY